MRWPKSFDGAPKGVEDGVDEAGSPDPNQKIEHLMRKQIRTVLIVASVIFVGLLILGRIATVGEKASRDSFNSTDAQFQNGVRNACITDRKSEQTNAQGLMLKYTLLAQKAGYEKDQDAAEHWIALGLAAIKEQDRASARIDPKIIDKPPPVGCGPPITSASQLHHN